MYTLPVVLLRDHFDVEHSSLRSIKAIYLRPFDASSFLSDIEAMPVAVRRSLESLTLCLQTSRMPLDDGMPITHDMLPQLKHLVVKGPAWPSLACDVDLLKGLDTLILGSRMRNYGSVNYTLNDPSQFFESLKHTRLRLLELWPSNRTGDNDYKQSLIDYLLSSGGSTLESLTIGFIRDRSQVEVIANKLPRLQHLQIETNESDIVFAPLTIKSLVLSSRRDKNIYYTVRTIRDHSLKSPPWTYHLSSLHLMFYQWGHSSCYVTIKMLPTLLIDVVSLNNLTMEFRSDYVDYNELLPAMCAWQQYLAAGHLETLTLKLNPSHNDHHSQYDEVIKVLEDGYDQHPHHQVEKTLSP
ncbi:hypothetical protein SAMD00019534_098170 [Acytostelium subglobosum LB1]|uniref:hypothetical protein n=1 Tax=Acytostelium subglobosum LB1 TaxID=1410327 RepID=UPI000645181B|nr:hypothetical protein SAMD00019534_098170 [Acytostelium subglobosum LB1]GAM26642.1 hypothetical protein SAMD00019534_098170 [Acytostelium subglobosum LB1]|eukprot:XP_012750303.1 hypothetical protein SAMD00019534_098170 [Acytostelium subglobosum LB1]